MDSYIFKMLFYLLISKETKVLKNLLSLKMYSMKSTDRINFTGFLDLYNYLFF